MDLQLEKYKLMEWLMSLKDESIIHKLKELKKDADSNYDVSETEKLFIDAGLKDIEEGNTFTHQEVMEEINKTYGI
ncbi:hypothetical protein [Kordia sp.]|uniref:hypothetical protein n=1 Tax=Kordia sp. TaxID=1965332 RepID=UPI003D273939